MISSIQFHRPCTSLQGLSYARGLGGGGGRGRGWGVDLGAKGKTAVSKGYTLEGGGHGPCEAIQGIGRQLQSLLARVQDSTDTCSRVATTTVVTILSITVTRGMSMRLVVVTGTTMLSLGSAGHLAV